MTDARALSASQSSSSGIDRSLEARVFELLDREDIDAAATAALRGYGPQIFGYLAAVLHDEARAGDAFSIFSENLWRGLVGFERKSSLRTWAYKIAFGSAMRVTFRSCDFLSFFW